MDEPLIEDDLVVRLAAYRSQLDLSILEYYRENDSENCQQPHRPQRARVLTALASVIIVCSGVFVLTRLDTVTQAYHDATRHEVTRDRVVLKPGIAVKILVLEDYIVPDKTDSNHPSGEDARFEAVHYAVHGGGLLVVSTYTVMGWEPTAGHLLDRNYESTRCLGLNTGDVSQQETDWPTLDFLLYKSPEGTPRGGYRRIITTLGDLHVVIETWDINWEVATTLSNLEIVDAVGWDLTGTNAELKIGTASDPSARWNLLVDSFVLDDGSTKFLPRACVVEPGQPDPPRPQ